MIARRGPRAKKSWWESTGIISSATAVLTVALTSVAAYWSQSALRQKDSSSREAQSAYEGETTVLQAANLLATESAHYAGERARILSGAYGSLQPEQRKKLVDSINASDTKWRQGKEIQKVGLELLFGAYPAVIVAWDSIEARLDRYANCTVVIPAQACDALRPPVDKAIDSFRSLAVADIRAHKFGTQVH